VKDNSKLKDVQWERVLVVIIGIMLLWTMISCSPLLTKEQMIVKRDLNYQLEKLYYEYQLKWLKYDYECDSLILELHMMTEVIEEDSIRWYTMDTIKNTSAKEVNKKEGAKDPHK